MNIMYEWNDIPNPKPIASIYAHIREPHVGVGIIPIISLHEDASNKISADTIMALSDVDKFALLGI
ncbi:hypothetical protein ACJX0J_006994, partial [Zea mays]